jgi:hypothetical protein
MNLAIEIIRMPARPWRRGWQGSRVISNVLLMCLLISGSLWGSPEDFRRHVEGIADPELLLLVNKTQRLDSISIPLDLVDLTGLVPAFRPGIQVRKIVLKDLTEMIAAAGRDHAKLRVFRR